MPVETSAKESSSSRPHELRMVYRLLPGFCVAQDEVDRLRSLLEPVRLTGGRDTERTDAVGLHHQPKPVSRPKSLIWFGERCRVQALGPQLEQRYLLRLVDDLHGIAIA